MLTRHQNSVHSPEMSGALSLTESATAGAAEAAEAAERTEHAEDSTAYERPGGPLVQAPLTTRYPVAPNAPEAAMR